jgi:hypothetical protein
MPLFGKPSAEELEMLNRRRGSTLDLSAYYEHLESLTPGDWGFIEPEAGENQRTIKRRLTTAAKQKGLELRYKKAEGERIYFRLNQPDAAPKLRRRQK